MSSLDYITGNRHYQPKNPQQLRKHPNISIKWEIMHCWMCGSKRKDNPYSQSMYCRKCRNLNIAALRERCRELYEEVKKLKERKEG